MKVSVIVPVYNVIDYMRKCFDSLAAQTLADVEFVVIDDGSTDESGKVCDDYARRDARFKVTHTPNRGPSLARQLGIDKATGEYIIYTDSDDYVDVSMLEDMYNEAKRTEADVVIADFWEETVGLSRQVDRERIQQQPTDFSQEGMALAYFSGRLHGAGWNKLVRRSMFTDNNIRLPYMMILEDLYATIAVLMAEPKVVYLPHAYYHYLKRCNSNSITREGNPKAGYYTYVAEEAFRGLLKDRPDFWLLFIQYTMPWLAYTSLYYGVSNYHRAFHELIDYHVEGLRPEVSVGLRCYILGRAIMIARRAMGKIMKLKG